MNLSSYREYQRESRGENLRGQRRPIGLLGAKRRLLAISILVLGLTTFFIPLISTDPAVMGTGSWSLWNVVAAVQNGTLTNPPNLNFIVIPGSIYVLMAVDFGLCFSTLFSVSKVQDHLADQGLGMLGGPVFSSWSEELGTRSVLLWENPHWPRELGPADDLAPSRHEHALPRLSRRNPGHRRVSDITAAKRPVSGCPRRIGCGNSATK